MYKSTGSVVCFEQQLSDCIVTHTKMSKLPVVLPPPPKPRANYVLAPKEYRDLDVDAVAKDRKKHLSDGQYHFYERPLMLVEASMQYCFDDKGKQYVDCYSNVCHIGHCHPAVVQACTTAMSQIVSNTRYLHPNIVKYAAKLKEKLDPSLSVCFFTNSGSEANDLALRLARIHTGRKRVICLENAYHGTTLSCTGVSPSLSTGSNKSSARDYEYCARDVSIVPVPDPYRGKYTGPKCGKEYAAEVERVTEEYPNDMAGFIHESVQGVGGQIVYPRDYLRRTYEIVRRRGGVCIADEVQTGFGRSGTHFWAYETQGVVPDIVVMGKPIGNGFPLGAVVCRREIAQSFDKVQYFNTNGGNPVACAAGLAVLHAIERDHLQENAHEVSVYLMNELVILKQKHRCIGDVRGVGMFIGIDIVHDRDPHRPWPELCKQIMEFARDSGILLGKGGAHSNVIRIKPPLCFTKEDAKFMVHTLDVLLPQIMNHMEACRDDAMHNNTPVFNKRTDTYFITPSEAGTDGDEASDDAYPRNGNGSPSVTYSLPLESKRARSPEKDTSDDDEDYSSRRQQRSSRGSRGVGSSPKTNDVLRNVPSSLARLVRDQ